MPIKDNCLLHIDSFDNFFSSIVQRLLALDIVRNSLSSGINLCPGLTWFGPPTQTPSTLPGYCRHLGELTVRGTFSQYPEHMMIHNPIRPLQ